MENSKRSLEQWREFASWSCSFSESVAIWEPMFTFRGLQSWVSGQTFKIRPSRGRGRYGLLSHLKFGIASRLTKAKLPTKGIQSFLDHFGDADFLPQTFSERMKSRFILAEDPDHEDQLRVFLFTDEGKFWLAVRGLTETPLRFSTLRLDDVLKEVLARVEAWTERREFVSQSAGDLARKALNAIRVANLSEGLPANAPRHGELN